MLLRSITKHVKDQNWFAVFLDFFIVVAGILIAFQITNWNEARLQRNEETRLLLRLVDEADELQTELFAYKNTHLEIAESNFAFAKLLEDPIGCSKVDDEFKRLMLTSSDFPPPRFSVSTINGLIDSGRLQLIRSQVLRDSVTEIADEFDFIERQWTRYVRVKQDLELMFTNQAGLSVTESGDLGTDDWKINLDRFNIRTPEYFCENPNLVGAVSNTAITQQIYTDIIGQALDKLDAYAGNLAEHVNELPNRKN